METWTRAEIGALGEQLAVQHLEAMETIYDALSEDWWDKQSFSPA